MNGRMEPAASEAGRRAGPLGKLSKEPGKREGFSQQRGERRKQRRTILRKQDAPFLDLLSDAAHTTLLTNIFKSRAKRYYPQ